MQCLKYLAALLLGAFIAPAAWSQAYPVKPIRLIIPFPPGGSNDIVGRMIGAQLGQRLGQQVIADNRGGAGGVIGTEAAARSQPDGYTLLIVSIAYAYNPSLYKLNFDPVKSLAPITLLGSGPNALAVHPSLPVKSTKELIALARAKPGQLVYASAGIGTFQHLSSELFRMMAGISMLHVPFKGGGPAMIDVISGNSQISIGSLIQTLPHIRSGRLKALGTGGAKRIAALPDVPTISESGLPGYEANNWWGMMAPAGTPAAVLKRLNEELSAIVNSAETQKRFSSEGAEARSMTPDDFARFIASEMTKWSKVVKAAGIKAE